VNVFYKSCRLKQYLKEGVALRIETVINHPKDLRCNRLQPNLPELQARARAINHRLLETETECTAIPELACSGPPPSCSPARERVASQFPDPVMPGHTGLSIHPRQLRSTACACTP
jgi:hypothetical protein